jgi:hypothetical protein
LDGPGRESEALPEGENAMTQPTACIRCKGSEIVPATFETGGGLTLAVDATHSSPVTARVCLACGAVMLTATTPAALRADAVPERKVQEYDF